MKDSNFFRAVKLYLKTSVNLFTLIFAIIWVGVYLAIFIFAYEHISDSEEYLSMLGVMSFGYYMVPFVFFGYTNNEKKRFFRTSPLSKYFLTSVPVFVLNVIAWVYTIIMFVILSIIYGFSASEVSDALIFTVTGCILPILSQCLAGRRPIVSVVSYAMIFVIMGSQYPLKFFMKDNTFGLSVPTGIIIVAAMYAVAYIVELMIMKTTYKKGLKIREIDINMLSSSRWNKQA